MFWMSVAPRILVIMPDQWRRALLRAALREVGYDAIGARNMDDARRYRAIEPGRGPVKLVLVDQEAVADGMDELRDILASHHDPPAILVAPATRALPDGPWSRIVHRPVSVADLVTEVESELPLPAEARHPLDPAP
jgi:DNA-binding NtrC family response regulator